MKEKGEHKCFFCNSSFNWFIMIKNNRLFYTTEQNEVKGIYAALSPNKLQIDIQCLECGGTNRIDYETNLRG